MSIEGKRAVVYTRLSISTDESVSIERQLESARDYCRARGWTIVAEHKDDGVSASASSPEDRKGWQEVLAHPKGTFDVVLIWKVDRLARRVIDFLNADKALQAKGAAVAAVDDPVDMSTAQGRAFATMLAVFAELEAESIRARVKDARRKLIADGRVPGGAAPFGYRNAPILNDKGEPVGGKILTKDEETIAYVTEAAHKALNGQSFNSICKYLDEVAPRTGRKNSAAHWTITVTKRMLSNPVLAGMTLHNPGNENKERGTEVLRDSDGMPVIREDLAVLSVDQFRRLEKRLKSTEPYKAATESYLSGLVWCGHCNRKMHRNAKTVSGKRVRVFQCQGNQGCGQQVTNLEAIVEQRFLEEFGNERAWELEVKAGADDYDLPEINRQITETMERMQDDDADVMMLAERLQSLKAIRSQVPDVEYSRELTEQTYGEIWESSPRDAVTKRLAGVRLVKGRKGRNFDQSRLSWMEHGDKPYLNLKVFGQSSPLRVTRSEQ